VSSASGLRAVAVFCGSSPGRDPRYREAAESLAAAMIERDVELVYGGGRVGLMGALSDAVLAAGGRVTGVIPTGLFELEVAHTALTELIEVGSMHERKAIMYDRADGFVGLPGGLGTLEELAEVTTWTQLGIHTKPVVLYDIAGFWDGLAAQLDHMVAEGFVRPENRALIASAPDAMSALDHLATARLPRGENWLADDER
jgi:uncharacterized protein (TIGR00730 family)